MGRVLGRDCNLYAVSGILKGTGVPSAALDFRQRAPLLLIFQ